MHVKRNMSDHIHPQLQHFEALFPLISLAQLSASTNPYVLPSAGSPMNFKKSHPVHNSMAAAR